MRLKDIDVTEDAVDGISRVMALTVYMIVFVKFVPLNTPIGFFIALVPGAIFTFIIWIVCSIIMFKIFDIDL